MGNKINNVRIPYEPKKSNRFQIRFPQSFNLHEWVCFETSRPKLNITSKSLTWENLVIKMYDPIAPSTTQALMDLVQKDKIADKFDLNFEMLDPIGEVVEQWVLIDCEFLSVDFGELSHNQDEMVICTLVIKIGKVVLQF